MDVKNKTDTIKAKTLHLHNELEKILLKKITMLPVNQHLFETTLKWFAATKLCKIKSFEFKIFRISRL